MPLSRSDHHIQSHILVLGVGILVYGFWKDIIQLITHGFTFILSLKLIKILVYHARHISSIFLVNKSILHRNIIFKQLQNSDHTHTYSYAFFSSEAIYAHHFFIKSFMPVQMGIQVWIIVFKNSMTIFVSWTISFTNLLLGKLFTIFIFYVLCDCFPLFFY